MTQPTTTVHHTAARPFIVLAIAAIIVGGLLSAFFAAEPSRIIMWVSAFLVLVLGIGQLTLGTVVRHITGEPRVTLAAAICALYNLAGFAIIAGTVQKDQFHYLVAIGSGGLWIALLGHMWLTQRSLEASWRGFYYVMMVILLVSTAIGVSISFW